MKAAVSSVVSAAGAAPVVEERPAAARVDLLARLEGICEGRGLTGLAERLADLSDFLGHDMASFEASFAQLPRDPRLVGRSATHLLDVGGKRLRPMCVALAARLGGGFSREVLDLAVAVELVHSATLLHDDVVDMSDTRRGTATARAVYGNAASIFAGDWLLVEALRRVQRCVLPGVLEALLDTIEEMIFAESVQLENRGRIRTSRDAYFRVVEGKTASVFRWALAAGGQAGGLPAGHCRGLASYGLNLGVAFQLVDDLLDLTGDTGRTGKELFTDLKEGKLTFPVIVALERSPSLEPLIADILATPVEEGVARRSAAQVVAGLRDTRAVEDCLVMARHRAADAVAALAPLPEGRARRALATIAEAIVDRDL